MNKLNFFDNFTYAKNTILIFLLLLLFISSTFAQEKISLQPKRIALIDWYALEDSETGIKNYGKAIDFAYNSGYISETDEEKRRKILEENFKKRYKILVEPIKLKISDLLKQFETENNLIILDGYELETKGLLLGFDKRLNVTNTFITYYNNKENKIYDVLKSDIPKSKIGLINTKVLFDKQTGLQNINNKFNNIEQLCPETNLCQELFKSFQSFVIESGYVLILDSTLEFPNEFNQFETEDITQKFIKYYNKTGELNGK